MPVVRDIVVARADGMVAMADKIFVCADKVVIVDKQWSLCEI